MRKHLFAITLSFATLFLSGCKDTKEVDPEKRPLSINLDNYPVRIATDWQDLHLQLIRTTEGYVPPVAARSLAYVNLGLYESTVHGTTVNKSLAGQLSHIKTLPLPDEKLTYNWGLAANAAQYVLLKHLFVTTSAANLQRMEVLRVKYENLLTIGKEPEEAIRSVKFGADIAEAIWKCSLTDNGHEAFKNVYPTYTLPVGLGKWVPVGNQKALLPNWKQNISFVQENVSTDPAAPLPFSYSSTSAFFKEAKEVYDVSKKLTAEQRAIALFFADGGGSVTPPGHHMNIATEVLLQKKASLGTAAETYVKMGLAINDAFIACWRCKYHYNLIRPITYIREAIDQNWTPLLSTPPFPEYTSGHSSGAGAAAEILKAQFGEATAFTDKTYTGVYPDRKYANFTDYANETSNSRIYGGIHYRTGCEEGVRNGRRIADNVLKLNFN